MTKQTEALKLAMEAMGLIGADLVCEAAHHEKADRHGISEPCPAQARWHNAFAAIREALAEQPAQQQEPTCKQHLQVWVIPNGKGAGQFSWEPQDERFWTRMQPAQRNPYANADNGVYGPEYQNQPAQKEPEYITNDGSFTDSELTLTNALIAVQHYCQAWVYAAFERDIGQHALALARIKALEQPAQQQEPVQTTPNFAQLKQILDNLDRCHHRDSKQEFLRTWIRDWTEHKLTKHTSPPASKPWVGLTDEEIKELDCLNIMWNEGDRAEIYNIEAFARAIEAKLRELNEHREKNV